MAQAATRQRAHELIDLMIDRQVPAVVGLLEILVDPLARSLANAPHEDEAISEEENQAATEARQRGYTPSKISHEEFLKEFGLTPDDFERMAYEPLNAEVQA